MNYCEQVLAETPDPTCRLLRYCGMLRLTGILAEVINLIFNDFFEVLCKRASPSRSPVDLVDMLKTEKLELRRKRGEIRLQDLTKPVTDSNSFVLTSTCWFYSWNAVISQALPQVHSKSCWNTGWNSFHKWSRVGQSHKDVFNCLFPNTVIQQPNLRQ